MTPPNYESKWWGYIYDQMMENLPEIVDNSQRFYSTQLAGVTGPILECACGTGLIWLHLFESGHDMYGFDISQSMLSTLQTKAAQKGFSGIDPRLSVQAMETFRYDQRFDAIIIPTHTFSMLATQDAQIQTLRNIRAHLAPSGRLLLDFRLPSLSRIAEEPTVVEGRWHEWVHPESGEPIRQRIVGRRDFNHQLVLDQCFIEYGDESENFPMTSRWIFKEEFQLLLRLAGFERWECFGTPEGGPLEVGLEETQSYWGETQSYWIAYH